jgi:predicted DNA-binding transcriptional regulator AlpA
LTEGTHVLITTNPNQFSYFERPVHGFSKPEVASPEWAALTQMEGLTAPFSPAKSFAPARWPEFMNIATLAEYLDMSASGVRKLIESGIIPGPSLVTSTRTKRWRKSEIDEVVARRVEARSKGPSLSDLLHSTDPTPAKRKGR